MTKEELVTAAAQKSGLSKKDTASALDSIIDSITEALVKGDKVTLVGFGSFQVKERAARVGRNPRTGAELAVAAKNAPSFTAGKGLKDAVK